MNDNNQIYIIASNLGIYSHIKALNFKGEIIKDINEECTYFIDVNYYKKLHKNYILLSNEI